MENVTRIDTVRKYNDLMNTETLHPLVSVVKFNEVPIVVNLKAQFGLYSVFLKDIKCGDLTYGCKPYDYEDGTLVFVAPGQVYRSDSGGKEIIPTGYSLTFHPDLLKGTTLDKSIKNYNFFNYEVNEALHLSKKERQTLVESFQKIAEEIEHKIDKHTKTLIVSNIELFLNYCMRYYERQFVTRSNINQDVLIKFEQLLSDYFNSDKGQTLGLPSVTWCAEQIHLSPNYFGDLIKKETGSTALDYIQRKIIEEAKTRILDSSKTINDVANELGFKYQQHFTRLFKQRTGFTPSEYRKLN
ncbi:helix-turn-helix domain-containing protein [Flavobacterium olei]|uniref:helix-turn-helix domain-containing protein n=1 Tax=Flavobacterium olei TaxID=1886782 RepID=UPI0032190E69